MPDDIARVMVCNLRDRISQMKELMKRFKNRHREDQAEIAKLNQTILNLQRELERRDRTIAELKSK